MTATISKEMIREKTKSLWASLFGGKFEGWELTREELDQCVQNTLFDLGNGDAKTLTDSIKDQCEFVWEQRREISMDYMNEPHDKGCGCDFCCEDLPPCEEREEVR